jgi:hypothetical protein
MQQTGEMHGAFFCLTHGAVPFVYKVEVFTLGGAGSGLAANGPRLGKYRTAAVLLAWLISIGSVVSLVLT